jgi:hypothetical protein
MDTNFSLNLFLVAVLFILYCLRESDFKTENFQNNSNEKIESEALEAEAPESELTKKIKKIEQKYQSKTVPALSNASKQYQAALIDAQNEADAQAQEDLIKINLASGNNSKKKENNTNSENDSIVGTSNDYLAKFNEIKNNNNKDSFVNTSNGLFNKHNLPPSSRPNVIDIFDATEPFVESEIVQHSFEGDGNIFLPKVYVY